MKKLVLILFASIFLLNVSAQETKRYSRANSKTYETDRSQRVSISRFERDNIKHNYRKHDNKEPMYVVQKSAPVEYHRGYNNEDRKYYKNHKYSHYQSTPVVCRKKTRHLPHNHGRYLFEGNNVFFSSGLFYKRHHDYYQQIAPPVGLVIYELPCDCRRISLGGRLYYEYANTIYSRVNTRRGIAFVVAGELNWD